MSAKWQKASPGLTATDWHRWLGDEKRRIDPYLVWGDLTRFKAYGGLEKSDKRLPILIELDRDWDTLQLPKHWTERKDCPAPPTGAAPDYLVEFSLLQINGAWLKPDISDQHNVLRGRHVTGSVAPANIECLLQFSSKVKRFQLGLARVPRLDERAYVKRVTPTGDRTPQVVVGVIDSGFPIAHPQLRDRNRLSRVMYLWDQDDRAGLEPRMSGGWHKVKGFEYGAELTKADIDKVLKADTGDASPIAALRPYLDLRYLPIRLEPDLLATQPEGTVSYLTMLTSTHGASVVDLAAGNQAPLGNFRWQQTQYGPPQQDDEDRFSTARAWPLVLVQLPTRTAADTSGGSLGVHVVDGVRYIIDRARRIPYRSKAAAIGAVDLDIYAPPAPASPPAAPAMADTEADSHHPENEVVINISYGANAGPHDGTSILEKALSDLARADRVAIVLSAGNAHGSGTNARLRLTRGGAKMLHWRVGPDNPLESYLEIWLPRLAVNAPAGAAEVDPHDFLLLVQAPGATEPCRLSVGQAMELTASAGGLPIAAAVFARRVVQGDNGTMILLAAAPTRRPHMGSDSSTRPLAPHGDWTITVCYGLASAAASGEQVIVHAWAERNDLLFGTVRAQQSSVWSDDPLPEPTENAPSVIEFCRFDGRALTADAPAPFQPAMSLSAVAGGAPAEPGFWCVEDGKSAVVAVGGYRASDLEMAAYSAGGPGRGSAIDNRLVSGGLCKAPVESFDDPQSRRAPDADAVSDVGTAARGVPAAGMLPGVSGRIGGTSAAAPSVTRAIAEGLFHTLNGRSGGPGTPQGHRLLVSAKSAGTAPQWPITCDVRATLTPTKDDRFRRGRHRVPRQVSIKPD